MAEFDYFLGTVLDEKYRLEKLLGKGGMGAVFLATHLGTERPVAVKLMAPRLMQNDEFIRRFSREAKAAGRLRHPNVVDVTDFGIARTANGPLAYLVMEYLDGCTLADILAEETRLPLDWAADILEQTCSAVHEAHQLGIVHRDLKPDNIWLEPNRLGGYRVKVLDFGLAKLAENAPATPGPATRQSQNSLPGATALLPVDDNAITLDGNATTLEENAPTSEHPLTALRAGAAATKVAVDKEAATIALSAAPQEDDEAATMALPAKPVADDDEPATREMSSSALAAAALQAIVGLERNVPPEIRASANITGTSDALHNTDLDGKVTRIGSIIGTPLYMSPEQCRGEKLSTATDIYSLGVIAYQMLAGETPFVGNSLQVIRQHREEQPVPVREKNKQVPRKIAALVMSALEKDPARRPPNVEAFASKFRASAEGVGTLLQKASAIYGERFVTLTKISLLVHLPMIFFTGLSFLKDGLMKWGYFGDVGGQVWSGILGFANFIGNYVSASLISGVTVLIVLQLSIAPLRPVRGREVLRMVWARFKPLLWTSFLIFILAVLACVVTLGVGAGLSLLLGKVSRVAGIVGGVLTALLAALAFAAVIVRNSLYAPVVLVEDLAGRAAMRRSSQLVAFALGTVIMVTAVQWLIPVAVGVGTQLMVAGISNSEPKFIKTGAGVKMQVNGDEPPAKADGSQPPEAGPEADAKSRKAYRAEVAGRLGGLLNILIVPLISIINALLYLKLRQLAGESRKVLLDSFENAEMPTSRWQQRMRERLTLTAPTTRTSSKPTSSASSR